MNVYKFFKQEKIAGGADGELSRRGRGGYFSNTVQRTLQATGMKSRQTLNKLRKNGSKEPAKPGPRRKRILDNIDSFDRQAIRRMISSFYNEGIWPTIAILHARLKRELDFKASQSTLKRLLKVMGYKWGDRKSRDLLKERPDIVAKRHGYLTRVKQLRLTGRCFVYLDETWLNSHHTVSKCWLDEEGKGGLKVPTGKGSRLIVLHGGTRHGFVSNGLLCFQSKTNSSDYHDEMDGERFKQWFKEQLLPNIPEHSIIVMDNASYHSTLLEKVPTLSSGKKADMQAWLDRHNISYSKNMIRVQLNQLILQNKPRFPSYIIDTLAESHGHSIVRLPPYHCELNPIELIWAQSKGGVAIKNNTFKLSDVKKLLEESISNVTADNWRKAELHVIKLEEEMYESEVRIDSELSSEQLATFRFCIGDDDETSDSESELSDDSDSDFDINNSDTDIVEFENIPEFPLWSHEA